MPNDISIPKPASVNFQKTPSISHTLSSADQQKLAATVAPTLEHIVSAAGFKLSPQQAAQLNQAFTERGTITIQPGGASMDVSLSVAGSCNLNGKAATQGHIE